MKTELLKTGSCNDREVILEAARAVESGQLVAFPTETVYGIAARADKSTLEKLDAVKGRDPIKRYTLHISGPEVLEKYVPKLSFRAEKLVKSVWPGPVTVVFELDDESLAIQREKLGQELFEILYRDRTIGVRCPENAVAQELLRQVVWPVVAPSANLGGNPPAINADDALEELDGRIEAVLDGGSCKYNGSSTVVRVAKRGIEVLREGVYPSDKIIRYATVNIVFVCSGNTCRSPMAEGFCKKYLSEIIGCNIDHLAQIGYKVASAGVIAAIDSPATREAVEVCDEYDLDIRSHRSQGLTEKVISDSDFIFVMTADHRNRILDFYPEAADKCRLLSPGRNIPDPIGGGRDEYSRCADLIQDALKERLGELRL